MTRSDFMVMVTTVFPDAVVTEGDRGELVIRTGWQVDPLDENNVTFMDRNEDVSFTLDDDSVHALSSYEELPRIVVPVGDDDVWDACEDCGATTYWPHEKLQHQADCPAAPEPAPDGYGRGYL